MKVSELIAKLQQMPPGAEVRGYFDSACRQDLAVVMAVSDRLVVVADSKDEQEMRLLDFPDARVAR